MLASTNIRRPSIEGIQVAFQSDGKRGTAQLKMGAGIAVDPTFADKLRGTLLRPLAVVQPDAMERLVVEKRLTPIVKVLQQIEPQCTQIVLVGPGMIYADVGAEKLLPMQVMGDGFKQMLALLVQLASQMCDVVLVDDIDAGLHFKLLSVLWTAVFAACKEFDVQLRGVILGTWRPQRRSCRWLQSQPVAIPPAPLAQLRRREQTVAPGSLV
jgi:hypothetical protein